jgi:uncharacterized protein
MVTRLSSTTMTERGKAHAFRNGDRGEPHQDCIQAFSSLTANGDAMKELIEYLAQSLVHRPEEVVVHVVPGERTTVYELSVGDGELGMVIGKQGRTIDAIRTILTAIAAKENKRIVLAILE